MLLEHTGSGHARRKERLVSATKPDALVFDANEETWNWMQGHPEAVLELCEYWHPQVAAWSEGHSEYNEYEFIGVVKALMLWAVRNRIPSHLDLLALRNFIHRLSGQSEEPKWDFRVTDMRTFEKLEWAARAVISRIEELARIEQGEYWIRRVSYDGTLFEEPEPFLLVDRLLWTVDRILFNARSRWTREMTDGELNYAACVIEAKLHALSATLRLTAPPFPPNLTPTADWFAEMERFRRVVKELQGLRNTVSQASTPEEKEARAILLLSYIGAKANQIAKAVGVARTTLLGWPAFKRAYDQEKARRKSASQRFSVDRYR
jgi:hypothetical protein